MSCSYCQILAESEDRRFFWDCSDSSFVIIDDIKSLTPLLILKEHRSYFKNKKEFFECMDAMKDVCGKLFGDYYYLSIGMKEHLVISSGLISN